MTGTLHREEFVAGYVGEAQEHLVGARRCLVAVEEALRRGQPAPRATRELFRALHTLKGLSGMIGADPIVDVAHEMEAVLRVADGAGGRLRPETLDAVVKGLAAIEERVGCVARGEPVPPVPQALLERFAALGVLPAEAPARETDLPPEIAGRMRAADLEQLAEGIAAGRRAVSIEFVPTPERAARGIDITAARERVGRLAEIVKVVPRAVARGSEAPAGLVFVLVALTSATTDELAAAAEAPPGAVREVHVTAVSPPADGSGEAIEPPPQATPQAFVRVEVTRLEEALEGVSALIVSRARLARAVDTLAGSGVDVRPLLPILQDHARELRNVRAAVMRARLVHLSEVLERAPLLVRGLARSSGKQVRLALEVGEAEVDKAVGERLFPAVVHLVRNAVDHAIEAPHERRSLGKPEDGTVRITARQRGEGQLEIEVSDDGRGIDLEAVAREAAARLPTTSPEILDLITRPGLSTMAAPTRTSGRGIGMDAVRRIVVTDLGGALEVSTRPGVGTTFTLRVPLSLTIVDGLTFQCAGETFVVPAGSVDELVEVEPSRLVAGPGPFRRGAPIRMLRWRDESIPYLELRDVLGLGRGGSGRRGIIVRNGGAVLGFGVDRMLGRQEVVIRPLRDPLVEHAGIAGATDLGNGRPTLVLDLGALTRALAPAAEERA